MSVCDECRDDFDAMSRLVESLPDDMKTSDCVLKAEMLLVALAYQKAEKENAELREQGARLFDKTLELGTENDGLRELVWDMLHDAMENICSKAYWCGEKNWQACNDEECGNRLYVKMARELGVEV